jgi:hypothetical protein
MIKVWGAILVIIKAGQLMFGMSIHQKQQLDVLEK